MSEISKEKRAEKYRYAEAPSVLLFLETSREFGRGLLSGIARYSRLRGPWQVHRWPGALDSSLPEWRDLKIDGAIVRDVKAVEGLARSGIPVIYAQHDKESYAPFPAVITESESIGTIAAEHFLDRGFQHFAYCGLDDYIWSRGRARSFRLRVERSGFEVNVFRQPAAKARRAFKVEQKLLANWLGALPKPVAVMCCNDDRALQLNEACKRARLYVPDEVAVLGVDNDILVCDLADPSLSSIALNTEAAGYEAAMLLDHLMKGGAMTGQEIPVRPVHIVTRMSTDILAVTDPDVISALHFIRLHPNRLIRVNDVVRSTNVSRRVLEMRFKASLRRSVQQEIRRVRVNHIVQYLVGTDLSITEIAVQCGFGGVEHIARYFRKEMGMSLQEYRKQYKSGPPAAVSLR
ncbi:MAG: DNA-binding transcriptional regulator [Sedimentisphaerales bacterium]|nr:DNA-binding transcriptional regulator [Sedimentisphaerales bacterium]